MRSPSWGQDSGVSSRGARRTISKLRPQSLPIRPLSLLRLQPPKLLLQLLLLPVSTLQSCLLVNCNTSQSITYLYSPLKTPVNYGLRLALILSLTEEATKTTDAAPATTEAVAETKAEEPIVAKEGETTMAKEESAGKFWLIIPLHTVSRIVRG